MKRGEFPHCILSLTGGPEIVSTSWQSLPPPLAQSTLPLA
jgi:hypothetical protein